MAAADLNKGSKKRKAEAQETPRPEFAFPQNVGLEMQSDDEEEVDGSESEDGEVEKFPEIDVGSDTEEEVDDSADDEENEEEEEDEDDEDEEETDDELHIFPKPKAIISDITGQPKLVYPEIEPDYDSDSSTEEV